MTSIDDKKRQTLKTFVGTGFGLASGALGMATLAEATDETSSLLNQAVLNKRAQADLKLMIVSSTGVVENSVVLTNTTDDAMVINRFRSENVIFNAQQVSLSALTAAGPITLLAGESKSFQIALDNLNTDKLNDYLWAHDCTTAISEDCTVVHVAGFMVGQEAILYATPHSKTIT